MDKGKSHGVMGSRTLDMQGESPRPSGQKSFRAEDRGRDSACAEFMKMEIAHDSHQSKAVAFDTSHQFFAAGFGKTLAVPE